MRGPGRGRWVLVLLGMALLVWAVAAPTWVHAGGGSVLTGTVRVDVAGTRAAPGTVGAALALAAAAAALALAGRVGRWVVVAVVTGCGVLVVWSAAGVLADPTAAARQAVATATGVDQVVGPVRTTVAPWFTIGVGLVVLACAALLGRSSTGWAGPSRRHELPGSSGAAQGTVRRPDADASETGPAADASLDASPPEPTRRDEPAEPSDERSAWDALSRGEDPT